MIRRPAVALRWIGIGWLAWRILGPEVPRRFPGVQERPLHVTGRTVMVGERELFVREAGPTDAAPLVLVHGWNFDGEMTFFNVIPELAQRYRVIVPDHRNHGKSDRVRGRYEIDDLADDLAGLLVALDVGPATVFGYSMGGMVAQALAVRHPEAVSRLVLAATAARPIPHGRWPARAGFWVARGFARISPREASAITLRHLLRIGALDERHARWMWAELLDRDATLYYEAGNAVWRFDSRSWVGRLGVPTRIVITTADFVVRPATQRALAASIDGADVIELEGAGHEAILTRPEDFIAAIDGFSD